MTPASWSAVDDAFDQALDLDGPERRAFLAGLDGPTRDAVASLLRRADGDDPVLDGRAPVHQLIAEADGDAGDAFVGARLGPYRLDALVGEGGMGRVYRAHRADGAFEQTVAVKIVRPTLALAGTDTGAYLRRERALLAGLDHPGIAHLLDGGETDDGVPYLVTELVDGAPITDWADARGLDVAGRVRLAIAVARAVDHAHRRSVVHRDLKPSNVLVAERDGAPRPVILDFGIAGLLDAAETGASGAPPRPGARLLTPAYAAPELFRPDADVTTAADVYGLGGLLYELLTGERPHADATGAPTGEPEPPSRRATSVAASPPDVVHRPGLLRGDLDAVCLRALQPDPAQRYASADALAADLERHLEDRPVSARPATFAYLAGRFVRRHRAVALSAVVALVALVGGLSVSLVSLSNERQARRQAEAEAARADEATALLAGLFEAADPSDGDGETVTARQALDAGLERVRDVESDTLRGYLNGVLGRTYVYLGEVRTADSLLATALAADRRVRGLSDGERARLRLTYASTRAALDDPARSLALAQSVLDDLGPDPDGPLVLSALRSTTDALLALDRPDEAIVTAQRGVRLARTLGDPRDLARALTDRGETLIVLGRPAEAVVSLQEAQGLGEGFTGRDRKYLSHTLHYLGDALGALGRHGEAEAAYRRNEAYLSRVFGSRTLGVGYTLAVIGDAQLRRGQRRRAAATLDSALAIGRAHLPADHPDLADWARQRDQAR